MFKWKKGLPTKIGYYWVKEVPKNKNKRNIDPPRIVEVRDYAGRLAICNAFLEGWEEMENAYWAGPIQMPEWIE
jgi:hypothetical protein